MPLDGTLNQDETLVILNVAQERIRDPKDWIESPRATDEVGNQTWGNDSESTQWCALGAVDYSLGVHVSLHHPVTLLLDQAASDLGFGFVAQANWDGYDTCHAMFDRAREIHMAKTKETVHA